MVEPGTILSVKEVLVPPDGRLSLLEKMDASSPESVMFMVVVTLGLILAFAIVKRNNKDD